MTAEHSDLERAPIIEAVVDIHCDLPPGFDYDQIADRAQEALKESFPKARRAISQSPESVTGALQFFSDDEKQLIQFRPEGFAFNRLAPYGSLDDYLPIIARSWEIFRELTRPIQIRGVALRFINRIALSAAEGPVKLADYFRCAPTLPDVPTLYFIGFLNQHAAIETATGNHVNILMAMQPSQDEILPVILDIETLDPRVRPSEDWDGIREAILALRRLKNDVFQRTLTPACLNLFR